MASSVSFVIGMSFVIIIACFFFLVKASDTYWCMHQKTAWLAIFYMCIPTGYALGYVYGGLVSFYLVLYHY